MFIKYVYYSTMVWYVVYITLYIYTCIVLMSKVSDTGGDQCDAVFVTTIDGVLISHGPTRVRDGFYAGLARFLDGVAPCKREERVGC